jgi:hypothetical protein
MRAEAPASPVWHDDGERVRERFGELAECVRRAHRSEDEHENRTGAEPLEADHGAVGGCDMVHRGGVR